MPDTTSPQSNAPTLPAKAGKEIGQSGTLIFGGIITGEEYNHSLTGAELLRKVEIMRRSSSTVRSALLIVKLPILGANWYMKAPSAKDGTVTSKDQEATDFINRELFKRNVDFFDFLRQATTCLDFGFSVFEKIYEATDYEGKPRIGISKLAFRKQNTIFKWEMNDGKPGVHQMVSTGKTGNYDIPREKIIIFTHEREGDNYEGVSLLRYAYKDWDMLDKLTIINAIALEKMGVGVPIVRARPDETPSPKDIADAKDTLANMRANEESFLSVPSTMEVEMLDQKANSTKEIIPTLNYHDRRISQSILAGFMELGGQSGSGAQSLSKDLTSLFMKSEEATAKVLQQTIMNDLIKQLCDLNFAQLDNGYPELVFDSLSDDDPAVTATSLGTLAEKKLLTPDLDTEDHLRKKFKLPALSTEGRDRYKKREELGDKAAEALANGDAPDEEGKTNPATKLTDKEGKKTDLKDSKPVKADPDDVKATALNDLKAARRKYIEVTFED